jgi:hypothetical protein
MIFISDYIYKYDDPLETGHKRFYLTKKQHNELFKFRKIRWADKYEYYYNEHHIILHKFTNMRAKILATLAFPFMIIIHGVVNFNELIKDYKRLYNEKKYGSFVSDHISKGSNKYEEVMKFIKMIK